MKQQWIERNLVSKWRAFLWSLRHGQKTKVLTSLAAFSLTAVTSLYGLWKKFPHVTDLGYVFYAACFLCVIVFLALGIHISRLASAPPRLPDVAIPSSAIRGLLPFTVDDGKLFVQLGRSTETGRLLTLARNNRIALIAVRGESGAGKTSLLQAGLAYALGDGQYIYWEAAPEKACDLLLSAIHRLLPDIKSLESLPEGCAQRCLLIVDSFEQLRIDNPVHESVFALLDRIAKAPCPCNMSAIVAFRRENLADWSDLEEKYNFRAEHVRIPLLAALTAEDVLMTLATEAGLKVEQAVVKNFISSVANPEGVSPSDIAIRILSMENHARQKGIAYFTTNEYRRAGGAEGLLLAFVQEKLDEIPESVRGSLLKGLVLGLINNSNNHRIAEAQSPAFIASKGGVSKSVLATWLERLAHPHVRLLEKTKSGHFRLSHERLVPVLRRLAGVTLTSLDQLRLTFEREHLAWQETHNRRHLLGGRELRIILRYQNDFAQGETARGKELYLRECRRQRTVWRLVAGSLGITLTVLCVLVSETWNRRGSVALAAQAEQKYSQDQPAALNDAIRGLGVANSAEAQTAVRDCFLQTLHNLEGHSGNITGVVFSPDSQRILTASEDNTARLWRASDGKLLAALVGHTGPVRSARFSSDGKLIVTASQDRTARVWDAHTGNLLKILQGHSDGVWSATFSRDGKNIVTASDDNTARIWNATSGKESMLLQGHTGGVLSAVFSSDGQGIVTSSRDRTARVWNAVSGRQLTTLQGHGNYVNTALFSVDDQRILTTSYDDTARVWDVATGQQLVIMEGHTDNVGRAEFSPDQKRIVTASYDNTARIWDAHTGRKLATLQGHSNRVLSAVFSPDGQYVLTGSADKTARVWKSSSGQLLAVLRGHTGLIFRAIYSSDGQRIVTTSGDHTARVWNAANSPQLIASLEGHSDQIVNAGFSFDSQVILTASRDKTVRLWNGNTGQPIATLQGHDKRVTYATLSPDGQRIVTASDDNTARVWSAVTGQLLTILQGHAKGVLSAVFSPDSQRIVTASDDKTARIWNANNGQLLTTLYGHTEGITSAVFSLDGQRVLTASSDKTARVWSATDGHVLAVMSGHTGGLASAMFSPDNQRVLTASSDKTARVWDTSNGQQLILMEGHTEGIMNAVFSLDGQRVVTASNDKTARVWNAANGQVLSILQGHSDAIRGAGFSPDGQRVITASYDKTARIWNVANGQPLTVLRGHQGAILGAIFSPNSQRILTWSADNTAQLFRMVTIAEISELLPK